jgi:hypothetical protein
MLEAFQDGYLLWHCPHCGRANHAQGSHDLVTHPHAPEVESVLEGSFVDEQGRTWTRHISRPTGLHFVDESAIVLPLCLCGTITSLNVTRDPAHHAGISTDDSEQPGKTTTRSIDALHRHLELADFLCKIGKGPDVLRKGRA